MAQSGKSTKPTYLAPGALSKSRSSSKSQPSLFPGFLTRGGTRGASLKNIGSSSSTTNVINQKSHDGHGGKKLEKEMEVNMISSENMISLSEDVIHHTNENKETTEDANNDNGEQNNSVVDTTTEEANTSTGEQNNSDLHVVTKRKKRAPDAKTRGVNKCKQVAKLGEGQKLQIDFYNNCPVGPNQGELTRHMGKLVRDRTIVPVQVHSWNDIDDNVKEHLWQSILNKFDVHGMDLRREFILDHMKRLWQNWRGLMKCDNINKKATIEDALKEVPNYLTKDDWEWLVKEHFLNDKLQEISARNSKNRGFLKMPHRTGSKPFREVVWSEMGGKDGKKPSISEIFKKTRMRKCGSLDQESAEKFEEIVNVQKENPNLSQFEVVEKCFGQQDRDHVVCFGFGMKPKDVRGPLPSREELITKLREKEKENDDLRQSIDEIKNNNKSLEEKVEMLMSKVLGTNSTTPSNES